MKDIRKKVNKILQLIKIETCAILFFTASNVMRYHQNKLVLIILR